MLICCNAEGVHGKRKVGKPCPRAKSSFYIRIIHHFIIIYNHLTDKKKIHAVTLTHNNIQCVFLDSILLVSRQKNERVAFCV